MTTYLNYCLHFALLLAASVVGPWLMLMALLGLHSDDLARQITAYVIAFAIFLNPKGVTELFLTKSHETLLRIAQAAIPSLASESSN